MVGLIYLLPTISGMVIGYQPRAQGTGSRHLLGR